MQDHNEDQLDRFERRREIRAELHRELAARDAELVRHLGLPIAEETSRHLRIGRHGGSLIINRRGAKVVGSWHDFATGESGDLVALIRETLGLDNSGALQEAARFLGRDLAGLARETDTPEARRRREKRRREIDEERARSDAELVRQQTAKRRRAAQIWREAKPVEGTIGERYLKKVRGLSGPFSREEVRFTAAARLYGAPSAGRPFSIFPAIVFAAHDRTGAVTSIQQIFLDPQTGEKIDLQPEGARRPIKPKKTLGKVVTPAILRREKAPRRVAVAEGPESALSVAEALDCQTFLTFGSANIGRIPLPASVEEIVLVSDGDDRRSRTWAQWTRVAASFAELGYRVRLVRLGDGVDANDFLRDRGAKALAVAIEATPAFGQAEAGRRERLRAQLEEESDRLRGHIFDVLERAAAVADGRKRLEGIVAARADERGIDHPTGWAWPYLRDADRAAALRALRRLRREVRLEIEEDLNDRGWSLADQITELVLGIPGLGKTRSCQEALADIALGYANLTILYYLPTLAKCDEFADDAARAGVHAEVVRGRSALDPTSPGNQMCLRAPVAQAAAKAGLPVYATVCDNGVSRCRHFSSCGSIRQREQLKAAENGLFVLSHAYLSLHSPLPPADIVIIDEDPSAQLETGGHTSTWAIDALLQRADDADEEEVEVRDYIGPAICNSLMDERPLTAMRSSLGLRPREALRKVRALLTRLAEEPIAGISPADHDGRLLRALEAVDRSMIGQARGMLAAIEREIEVDRDEFQAVQIRDEPVQVDDLLERQVRIRWWGLTRLRIAADTPLLLLDGTANPDLLSRALRRDVSTTRFTVERNAEVWHIAGSDFSDQGVLGYDKKDRPIRPEEAEKRRQEIGRLIAMHSANGPVFVGSTKRVRAVLEELFPGAQFGHFGAMRGINAFEHCSIAIVVGRQQPSTRAVEDKARAYFATDEQLIETAENYVRELREITLRDGSTAKIRVQVHPDPRVQAVLEQLREAELVQTIDRVRAARRRRKIIVMGTVPVPGLTIDRYLTAAEERQGGTRFERAMDEGNGLLPLSGGLLARTAPAEFATQKAAEKYLERQGWLKPPTPQRESIWGVGGYSEFAANIRGRRARPVRVLVDPRRFSGPLAARRAFELLIGEEVESWKLVAGDWPETGRGAETPSEAAPSGDQTGETKEGLTDVRPFLRRLLSDAEAWEYWRQLPWDPEEVEFEKSRRRVLFSKMGLVK